MCRIAATSAAVTPESLWRSQAVGKGFNERVELIDELGNGADLLQLITQGTPRSLLRA
jgi:hypothetical protein